ncbi:MAG: YciI family protein [Bacteroidota bacterium]
MFTFTLYGQDSSYDPELAIELGADDYGMKMYSFVILKTGPVEVTNEDSVSFYMSGHLANISRLAEEGKLSVAGPFGPNDLDYRGLFIIDAQTTEEAQELLSTDPAIARGIFETEIIPWYGSAALPTYLENHTKIEKVKP